jgi:hypothetical protein
VRAHLAFLLGAVAVLIACTQSVPDPAKCVSAWNDPSNLDGQRRIAKVYRAAVVYGWRDKAGERGCALQFVQPRRGRWIEFSRVMDPGSAAQWAMASGRRWGQDNAEGSPTNLNVTVTEDGHVALRDPL